VTTLSPIFSAVTVFPGKKNSKTFRGATPELEFWAEEGPPDEDFSSQYIDYLLGQVASQLEDYEHRRATTESPPPFRRRRLRSLSHISESPPPLQTFQPNLEPLGPELFVPMDDVVAAVNVGQVFDLGDGTIARLAELLAGDKLKAKSKKLKKKENWYGYPTFYSDGKVHSIYLDKRPYWFNNEQYYVEVRKPKFVSAKKGRDKDGNVVPFAAFGPGSGGYQKLFKKYNQRLAKAVKRNIRYRKKKWKYRKSYKKYKKYRNTKYFKKKYYKGYKKYRKYRKY